MIDGDTIDVLIDLGFYIKHQVRLRLLDVDTPEIRTRDKKEKEAGLRAKAFVISELTGRELEIRTSKKGKYGRYLAIVFYWKVDKWFNLRIELIEGGYTKLRVAGKD